jgi:hypothetical protein
VAVPLVGKQGNVDFLGDTLKNVEKAVLRSARPAAPPD